MNDKNISACSKSAKKKNAWDENAENMPGCRYKGNASLLSSSWSRIGVFASRSADPAVCIQREQWAMEMGRTRRCLVGTFHSHSEREILFLALKYGGSAVWFLGCSFPKVLPAVCHDALLQGRLLIVSCFHREHHCFATARYCTHLADLFCNRLVIWSIKSGGLLQPLHDRAKCSGKMMDVF